MRESNCYQRAVLQAETWTHVHIGSGRTLSRWEYYLDNGKLRLLDYAKLAEVAQQDSGVIDRMTREAAKDSKASLTSFLKKERKEDLVEKITSRQRALPADIADAEEGSFKLRELKLFVGSPNCYIPGSSVKGALRTAFISSATASTLPQDPQKLKKLLDSKFGFESADNKIFQHIVVRDTERFREQDLGIAAVRIFARQPVAARPGVQPRSGPPAQKPTAQQDTYCEMVMCETKFNIELIVRTGKLKECPVTGVTDMLSIADRFYRRVWEREKRNRQRTKDEEIAAFYAECTPPEDVYLLRLGFGSGQLATSILMDYQDKYKDSNGNPADQPLRQGPAYKRNSKKLALHPYPRTAKSAVAASVAEEQPLGWVVISKNLEIKDVD